MIATLNVGLQSDTLGRIPSQQALSCVRQAFGVYIDATYVRSDTEPTLVVSVFDQPSLQSKVFELAERLGQDCIAFVQGGVGQLIGPRAAAWGEFNPEFFFLPSGQRMLKAAA